MSGGFAQGAGGGGQPGLGATITNENGTKVLGQFAVHYGDVTYNVDSAASPEQRFQTGVEMLKGGMGRRAEEMIREAVERNYRSNQVLYYWALSVLSARSFDHLGTEDFDALRNCYAMANTALRDAWLQALTVVMEFISCLIRQDGFIVDDSELDQVTAQYGMLPPERREEIRRHLDQIMTGALQDRLDTKYAAEVGERRMDGDRANRAWKFFEAEPEPPRLRTFPEPRLNLGARMASVVGVALAGVSLLATLIAVAASDVLFGLIFAVGAGGGGYLLATSGKSWLVARERAAADDARHGEEPSRTRYALEPPADETADADDFTWGETDKADENHAWELLRRKLFNSLVAPWVTMRFADLNPDGANGRKKWEEESHGLREALTDDIRRRYASDELTLNQLDWLVKWNARKAKDHCDKGTLRAHRAEVRPGVATGALAFLGLVGMLGGLIFGTIGAFDWRPGAAPILLAAIVLGALIAWAGRIDAYLVRRDLWRAESAYAASRHNEETAEFDRWQHVLEDRPTDAEMARWLDYDKIHIKNLVMRSRRMVNRDIEAHAVLTEALNPCRRARVLYGPPRYSRYRVIVILLTQAGVRHVSMDLDFFKGIASNELSDVFRYDSISSAKMLKVGIRFDEGERSVILLDDRAAARQQASPTGAALPGTPPVPLGSRPPGDGRGQPAANGQPAMGTQDAQRDGLIFGQALRLTLVAREHIDVVVENIDEGFLDRVHEQADTLLELALDTSGVRSAQQVLEHVAAEGGNWLAEERRRRNRRMLDFGQGTTRARELRGRAYVTELPSPATVPSLPVAGRTGRNGTRQQLAVVQVAVPGGILEVERVTGATEPVLAIHGLASQRRQWNWLRADRPDLSLVTPDLRGRGGSANVRGQSSLAQHAADMLAVLDSLEIRAAHVCAASLGGAVAVEMAVTYPERVKSLILIDGGFPTKTPHRLTPEAAPALSRNGAGNDPRERPLAHMDMTWSSVTDYARFFTKQLAPLLDPGDPLLLDYLAHDLDGHRVRANKGMLTADLASAHAVPATWQQVAVPVRLIVAEWSIGTGTPPAYPRPDVQAIRQRLGPLLSVRTLPGTDHASAIMSRVGARESAAFIADAQT